MAEEVAIDLNIKTGEAEKNTQSLKGKLKQLKLELESLEEGSDAFNKIALEAAEAEDKLGDLSAKIKTLSSDTRKLDTVVGVAQGIAGGFAAAQGAAALFGAESEDLNKALIKIQASLALLNGVEAIANTLKKEGAVATNAASAANAIYAFFVNASTGAVNKFRVALAATGIGLVIIAIGLLITYWDDLTAAINGSTEAMDKQAEATRQNIKDMQEQQKALVQNTKDKIATTLAELEGIKAIREQMGLDTIAIDEKIRAVRLMGGATEQELRLEQIKKETALTIEQLKDRAAKEAEQEKARLAAKEQAAKDEASRLADLKKQFEEDNLETLEYEEAERLKLVQAGVDEATRIKKEANAAQLALDDILAANELKNIEEVAAAKRKAIADGFAIATASVNAFSALNNLITQNENQNRSKNAKERLALEKKQFERGKALGIVNTVINTAQAIMAQMANPTPYVGIALAALAGVTGALQVAAIASQKFDGGSGTITQVGSVGAIDTPSANNAPAVPLTPQSIPIPQQVFVTETDITGTQQQVNVIEGLSKIQ